MRVFGAAMMVLGAVLLAYGVSIVAAHGVIWRLGELLAVVGFFLAWWGVNCLFDRPVD